MADIREFAEQAANMYAAYQDSIRDNQELYRRGGLPARREAALQLIHDAYNASLIPDEGRYPKIFLMCYQREATVQFHTLFNVPLPSSADEIAKLSQAVDNHSHIACICEDNRILLAGFHVSSLYNSREYGYSSDRIANPLKIRIKGPGSLEVSCTRAALVFHGGNIAQEAPLQLSNSMERLVERVRKELEEVYGESRTDALDDVFNDLVREIVRLGHGGMIIFNDSTNKSQFSSLRQTHCSYLQDLLFNYWIESDELLQASGGVEKLLSKSDSGDLGKYMMRVARATSHLENCLPAIANLSGMDGAIVFTYGCNVGAFNAIINRQKEPECQPKLVDTRGNTLLYEKIFAHRGSRHQSGLLYARSVPDSFVFVISQDGSVSAFHNPNDGTVICEFGLRPME